MRLTATVPAMVRIAAVEVCEHFLVWGLMIEHLFDYPVVYG